MGHDEKVGEELAASAAKLDAAGLDVPDFQFFKSIVEKQQTIMRRSQRRQLALFTAVAAMLVSALIVGMGWSLAFVIALQGAAVAGAIAGLTVFFLRSRRSNAVASR